MQPRIALSMVSVFVVLSASAEARAHPLRFGVLEVVEHADGEVTARLRYSGSERSPQSAEIVLPDGCRDVLPAIATPIPYGIERERRASCEPGALAAGPLGVRAIGEAQVMLRVRLTDGRTTEVMLDPAAPTWRSSPEGEGSRSVIERYGALGVEHILLGLDHLLFLAVLLLMIRERRSLVIAITAFTAGHSATLVLAVLDVVRLPSAPVEAAIAISIAVVAAEVVRRGAREPSRRDAALLPGAFGLIHGLGFAGVLREIGLPDAQLVPALLSFNVGVEIGQLLFVSVAIGLFALVRRLAPAIDSRGTPAIAYAAGIAATVLCIDRVLEIGAFS